MSMRIGKPSNVVSATLASMVPMFFVGAAPASADFTRPSPACPGAIELIEGTSDNPKGLLSVFIPSGGTATCFSKPVFLSFPFSVITGDGSNITFTNILDDFAVNLTGDGHRVINNAEQFGVEITGNGGHVINNGGADVRIEGSGAEITNKADLSGLIEGNDTTVINEVGAVISNGFEITGDRTNVFNDGSIVDSGTTIGVLLMGDDATITNRGSGTITADDEALAAVIVGARGKITNEGTISGKGLEAVAAGIEGDGTEEKRAEIINDGMLDVEGTESSAAFIEGDHGFIQNNSMINAMGEETAGMFIEGDHGEIENSGMLTVEGNLAAGAAIEGDDAKLTNNADIDIDGDVAVGMGALGARATVTNTGKIESDGENAFGMGVFGLETMLENKENAEINTNGGGSHGIFLGLENAEELAAGAAIPPGVAQKAQGEITNDGSITTFGVATVPGPGEDEPAGADGIHVFADNTVINNNDTGAITTLGRNSSAIKGIGDDIIVNQAGETETRNANSDAISIEGDRAKVINTKKITTMADKSAGVFVEGADATILNGDDGEINDAVTIETAGEMAHGIALGRQSTEGEKPRSSGDVKNFGKITTSGDEADGIHSFANNGVIENHNEIKTTGDRASGVNQFGDDVSITNLDEIMTEGDMAPGIRARGQNLTITNGAEEDEVGDMAMITTKGEGSHGILVAPESGSETNPQFAVPSQADITNLTTIETEGEKSHGVLAFIDDSTIENKGDIKVTGKDSRGVSTFGDMVVIKNEGTIEAGTLEIAQAEIAAPDVGDPPTGRVGIDFNKETSVENTADGQIMAFGENSAGVRGRDANDSSLKNDGTIIAFGKNARGVDIEGDAVSVQNVEFNQQNDAFVEALITVEGENAIGVRTSGAGAFVSNRVTETEAGVETVGVEVFGDNAIGVDATATDSGAFLIENVGKMVVDGANAVGMALRNATGGALGFSAASGQSECGGSAKGAGLVNCGDLTVRGDNAVGLLAEGLNDSTIDNIGKIDVGKTDLTGVGATAINLDNGANGAGANNNFILNVGEARARGANATGVLIKGDNNILVQGNDAVVIPINVNTFTVISNFVERAVDDVLEPDIPLGVINAIGENAVGVNVAGANNFVGISLGLSDVDPPQVGSIIATGAGSVGVQLSGEKNTLSNFGLVSGERFSVLGGAGKDIIIAAGAFDGAIDLGEGEDEFNLLGGTQGEPFAGSSLDKFNGIIDGGDGADVFRVVDGGFFGATSDSGVPADVLGFGEGVVDSDKIVNFEFFDVEIENSVQLINTLDVFQTTIFAGELNLDDATINAQEILISTFGVLSGNGRVSVVPDVDNPDGLVGDIRLLDGGKITPGNSPGLLTLEGDFTFGGILEIEIAGLEEGLFDRLIVDGDMFVAGGLIEFVFLDNFLPEAGDSFEFLTVTGEISGLETLEFAFVNVLSGFEFDLMFSELANGGIRFDLMTIMAGGVPDSEIPIPATWLLFASGLGFFSFARGRKKQR